VAIEINREKLAWAAGFFDGEGSAYVNRTTKHGLTYVELCLACTQHGNFAIEILEKFLGIVKFGRVYRKCKLDKWSMEIAGKTGYEWKCQSWSECQYVICMLWPFLSGYKRKQIICSMKAKLEHINRPVRRRRRIA
jgi:hypothetical protein